MTGHETLNLTEKLAAKQSQILAEAASLTSQQLQQHAQTITQQCNAVLNTIKSDTLAAQSEASAAIEALKKTLEASQTLTLTELQQSQIRERLQHQISSQQAAAVKESLAPLKKELRSLQQEAQSLSKVTLKGWLKPLLIGAMIAIGVLLTTVGGTLMLDRLIGSRTQTLSDLQSQIRSAEQTLSRLPAGVEFIQDRTGNRFITAPKLSAPFTHQGRQYVQIED